MFTCRFHLAVGGAGWRVEGRGEWGGGWDCTFDFLSVPSLLLIYKWRLGVVRGRRRRGGQMGARVKVLRAGSRGRKDTGRVRLSLVH